MSTQSSYNNDLFVMESNGTLKSAVEFDYETASEFVIQVGVMDTSNATTSAIFNVSVIDLNDSMANQGPQDLVSLQILQVEENQPVGTLVGEFNASDPDGDSLFYFLTSGIGDDNNSLFTISGNQLRTNEIFDFESYHTLSIRVGVMDSEDATIDGNFTVIILDVENDTVNQAPENLHAVSDLIVSQDHILGSLVGEFNATDPEGGALSFFLTDATPNNDNSKFMITVDGELKVEELLSFDENQTLSIVVGVRDEYNASMEDTFTVFYVIDDTNDSLDPFYFESTNLAIYENAEIGSEVGSFHATGGLSAGESVGYTVTLNDELFQIDENGTLRTKVVFDFEEMNQTGVPLEVLGTTSRNRMTVREFLVEILDVNDTPPFDFNATELVVLESAEIGTVVGQFILDSNISSNVVFELNDPNSLFEISQHELLTRVDLDYDNLEYYNLKIEVLGTNENNETKVHSFNVSIVDVNYAPTQIVTEDDLRIVANKHETYSLGPFTVVDKDSLDTHIIELVDGQSSNGNQFFAMNNNGMLEFLGNEVSDDVSELNIRLRATDSNGSSVEETFSIAFEQEEGDSVVMLSEGVEIVGGWKRAGWFGYYFGNFYPWVHHENLGWIFIEQRDASGVWFYREGLGWSWTNPKLFPFIFLYDRQEWTFLSRYSFPALLFDYKYMEWHHPDRLYQISVGVKRSVGGQVKGGGYYSRWEKVRLEAVPDAGFTFSGWSGDLDESGLIIEHEVHRDLSMTAIFQPVLNTGGNAADSLRSINQYIQSLGDLTEEEKKKAMSEILIYGKIIE